MYSKFFSEIGYIIIWCPKTISQLYQLLVTTLFYRSQGRNNMWKFNILHFVSKINENIFDQCFSNLAMWALSQLYRVLVHDLVFQGYRSGFKISEVFTACVHNKLKSIDQSFSNSPIWYPVQLSCVLTFYDCAYIQCHEEICYNLAFSLWKDWIKPFQIQIDGGLEHLNCIKFLCTTFLQA